MIRVGRIQIPTLLTQKPRRRCIYTPKGYEGSEARYPVLYMFEGTTSSATATPPTAGAGA